MSDDRTRLDRFQDLGATILVLGVPAFAIALFGWLLGWWA